MDNGCAGVFGGVAAAVVACQGDGRLSVAVLGLVVLVRLDGAHVLAACSLHDRGAAPPVCVLAHHHVPGLLFVYSKPA